MSWIFFIAQGQGGKGSKSDRYLCVDCGAEIADSSDRISVMARPPRRTYVNPHGTVCEVVTLAACQHYRPGPFSSTENTWFDGYAWRPLGCAACDGFLGWRFEAVGDRSTGTASGGAGGLAGPRRFYGLLTERLIV